MNKAPAVHALMEHFHSNDHEIRLVGGCVRDSILGREAHDLDFATTATPDEMFAIFDNVYGYTVHPTGVKYGTVTIVNEDNAWEVTTLRQDVVTDGRHAEVAFTTSFKEDARRRDLTINAMSMDINGKVYDYFGGKEDINNCILRFVGNADERIQEDYLRILRFLRFTDLFGENTVYAKDGLEAIVKHREGLVTLSRERITQELKKMLTSKSVNRIVRTMAATKVGDVIGIHNYGHMVPMSDNWIVPFVYCRGNKALDYVRLSNAELALFNTLVEWDVMSRVCKLSFEYYLHVEDKGKELEAYAELTSDRELMTFLRTTTKKTFPVRGSDVVAKGHEGKSVGRNLEMLLETWVSNGYSQTKEELLN